WPLSIVIAGAALPALSASLGWRAPYYIIAAASAALSASYLALRRAKEAPPRGSAGLELGVLKDPNVLTVSAAGFLFFLSYWAVTLYAYRYFLEAGLGDYEAGFAYSLLALAGIPSTVIAGTFMKKIGVKRTLVVFEAAYGLLTALLGAARGALLFLNAALMGFVRFVITPANSTAVSLAGRGKAGSAAGMANLFWQSSGVVAPIVAAYVLSAGGYEGLWLLSGALAIASALMYLGLLKI
ncbi:MAG: MFS transporter, partial [Thermoproteus sp.]